MTKRNPYRRVGQVPGGSSPPSPQSQDSPPQPPPVSRPMVAHLERKPWATITPGRIWGYWIEYRPVPGFGLGVGWKRTRAGAEHLVARHFEWHRSEAERKAAAVTYYSPPN